MTNAANGQDRDGADLSAADEQLLRELTQRARAGGLKLTGEGGLLGKLTKMVVEGALEGEMDDHLGYGKHDPAGCQTQDTYLKRTPCSVRVWRTNAGLASRQVRRSSGDGRGDPLLRRCRTLVRYSLLPGEIVQARLIAGYVIQPCWCRFWVSQIASGCHRL